MSLHTKNFALSLGIVTAGVVFLSTVVGMVFNFGMTHAPWFVSIIPGYSITVVGSFLGLVYGFVFGYVIGYVFAYLYNMFSG